MRRIAFCLGAVLIVLAAAAPDAAVASNQHGVVVAGTFRGKAQYLVECRTVIVSGSGTFRTRGLGRGTYAYRVCATIGGPVIPIVGTITLTPEGGGTVTGTIEKNYKPPGKVILPVVVTGGTQRFAHARGTLSLGPIGESHFTNCDENLCLDWKEAGPITGTIRHVA